MKVSLCVFPLLMSVGSSYAVYAAGAPRYRIAPYSPAAGDASEGNQKRQSGSETAQVHSYKRKATGSTDIQACDFAEPFGTIDAADVQAAIAMVLGAAPCPAKAAGTGVCNAAMIQRVINASISGGGCLNDPDPVGNFVVLTWADSGSPDVIGYNVYRSNTQGGPYTKLTVSPIGDTTFADGKVDPAKTYYYVTTSVNGNGLESTYSNEASASLPDHVVAAP